ncbi:MAG TPA: oligosaccharide flippase family protein [Methylomirabilota bacterium]|jgi:O-antigen/teichoic acid export membrane protein|nr:oligosaccharide flippase family protein [Methylomirabilota bacterium]
MLSKIKTLLGHTLVYGLGSSGTRLIGFFLIPVYTRYLTPVDYGVLALVGMLDQILFIVMNMGQSTAVFRTYFNHEDPAQRHTVLTTSLWLNVTLSLPVGLLALALSQPLGWFLTGNTAYTTWVMIGIGAVAFKSLVRLPFAVLRAREESRRYASFSFARTAVGLFLAVTFVVGLHLGGRGVLLSQLLAELLMLAVLLPLTLRGFPLKFSRRDAKDLLGYGVYLLPSGLLSFLLHLSDRYFLRHFGSLGVVGLYALGYRFAEILAFVMSAFLLAWPPFLFSNRKHADAPALYARVFTYVLAVAGFIWLVLALLAEEIVTIMAAPAFREAYHVIPWIAGAFLFEALASVGNVGMPMHRKVKYRPLILGVVAALNIGLNLVLIPRYGALGAAASLFTSFVVRFFLELTVGYQLYPVPYEYPRIARLALMGAAIYWFGTSFAWGSMWVSIPVKLFLLLLAPLALYASGFFQAEELGRLRTLPNFRRWSSPSLQTPKS